MPQRHLDNPGSHDNYLNLDLKMPDMTHFLHLCHLMKNYNLKINF